MVPGQGFRDGHAVQIVIDIGLGTVTGTATAAGGVAVAVAVVWVALVGIGVIIDALAWEDVLIVDYTVQRMKRWDMGNLIHSSSRSSSLSF